MKTPNHLLLGLLVLLSIVSCTKPRHICRGCDEPQSAPDTQIQGELVGPNAYAGSGNCETGAYKVRHSDIFTYTFSYVISNGRMIDFSFSNSFTFSSPALSTGSLVYKNMAYNDGAKKISVLISYQTTITEQVQTGVDVNGNPVFESKKNTRTYDFIDVINTCDNSFVLDI